MNEKTKNKVDGIMRTMKESLESVLNKQENCEITFKLSVSQGGITDVWMEKRNRI